MVIKRLAERAWTVGYRAIQRAALDNGASRERTIRSRLDMTSVDTPEHKGA